MNTLAIIGGLAGALLLAVWALIRGNKKNAEKVAETKIEAASQVNDQINARNEEVQAANEEVLEDVAEEKHIEDRLNRDPDYAQRVQDRFQRPD